MDAQVDKDWFTDNQLCARWSCSKMKLWRLRQRGKLSQATKIGGTGPNLTRGSEVRALEGGDHAIAA